MKILQLKAENVKRLTAIDEPHDWAAGPSYSGRGLVEYHGRDVCRACGGLRVSWKDEQNRPTAGTITTFHHPRLGYLSAREAADLGCQ